MDISIRSFFGESMNIRTAFRNIPGPTALKVAGIALVVFTLSYVVKKVLASLFGRGTNVFSSTEIQEIRNLSAEELKVFPQDKFNKLTLSILGELSPEKEEVLVERLKYADAIFEDEDKNKKIVDLPLVKFQALKSRQINASIDQIPLFLFDLFPSYIKFDVSKMSSPQIQKVLKNLMKDQLEKLWEDKEKLLSLDVSEVHEYYIHPLDISILSIEQIKTIVNKLSPEQINALPLEKFSALDFSQYPSYQCYRLDVTKMTLSQIQSVIKNLSFEQTKKVPDHFLKELDFSALELTESFKWFPEDYSEKSTLLGRFSLLSTSSAQVFLTHRKFTFERCLTPTQWEGLDASKFTQEMIDQWFPSLEIHDLENLKNSYETLDDVKKRIYEYNRNSWGLFTSVQKGEIKKKLSPSNLQFFDKGKTDWDELLDKKIQLQIDLFKMQSGF